MAERRLKIIHSPYRELFEPLLDYVNEVACATPDALLAIIIPKLVQPRWWEYLPHTHVAATLKAMLFLRGRRSRGGDEYPVALREK